jgi:hypothetical protein
VAQRWQADAAGRPIPRRLPFPCPARVGKPCSWTRSLPFPI